MGDCRGNHGYEVRSDEGEKILGFAEAHSFVMANVYFTKKG